MILGPQESEYSYQVKVSLFFRFHFPGMCNPLVPRQWGHINQKKKGERSVSILPSTTYQASIKILTSVWSTSMSEQRFSIPSGLLKRNSQYYVHL